MRCATCWEATEVDPCAHCDGPALLDGRYRLQAPLGEGRAGVTWRAERVEDGAVVAIKELPLGRARSAKDQELIEREAAVLRQLAHPGVPRFHEAFVRGRGRGRAMYIVEDFIDGPTLEQELRDRRFDEEGVLEVLDDLLGILGYLHGLSPPVIHRDIKPANVMRRPDGRLVLVDFGAVRDVVRDPDLGGSTVAGTFGYMAPEQFRGDALRTTDLYGLGALAVALLTRKQPHTLQDHAQRTAWRAHANVSAPLASLVDAMLEPDHERRPGSVGAVRNEVRRLRAFTGLPRFTVPQATPPPPPSPAPSVALAVPPDRSVDHLLEVMHDLRETRLVHGEDGVAALRASWRPERVGTAMVFGMLTLVAGFALVVALVTAVGEPWLAPLRSTAPSAAVTAVPRATASPPPLWYEVHIHPSEASMRVALLQDPDVRECFVRYPGNTVVEMWVFPSGEVEVEPVITSPLQGCVVAAGQHVAFPPYHADYGHRVTVHLP